MKDMNIEECKFLNYCSGNGKCEDGKCICDPGWMNYDCSISKYINLNIMSLYWLFNLYFCLFIDVIYFINLLIMFY